MAVLSFEAAGGRAQAQREGAWSADADKGRRPPHPPRTFRTFAAAMRRCKQGAMRKIQKYAAIVPALLLVAAGREFKVVSRPEAPHLPDRNDGVTDKCGGAHVEMGGRRYDQ